MLEHLSIFIENKPGKLNRIVEILAGENINIRAFSIAGAGSFGVVKMLVDQPEKAAQVLCARGLAVARKQIVAAVVNDSPGSLHDLLGTLSKSGVNVADSYGFLLQSGKSAVVVLECDDLKKATEAILSNGFKMLPDNAHLSL